MADELKPGYLLAGSDRPKIARALGRLRARFDDAAVELLSAAETNGEAARAACNSLGLFGGGARLVIVGEVERWKTADVDAIRAYLDDPAPATVLALTGDVKSDGALARAVGKRGEVLVFDVPKRALPRWVREQFERFGAHADDATARTLIELAGDDLDQLVLEVEKLATWAASGEDPIEVEDVERLVAGTSDTSVFALTDAWGRRDVVAVVAATERFLERSQRPRRDEVARIAGLLAAHVVRVRVCQRLAGDGVRPRDAAAKLRQHPFAIEKAFAHAARYSEEELRDAVVRLAELDHALKGSSRLPSDLELVRALVDVTSERAAAAEGASG